MPAAGLYASAMPLSVGRNSVLPQGMFQNLSGVLLPPPPPLLPPVEPPPPPELQAVNTVAAAAPPASPRKPRLVTGEPLGCVISRFLSDGCASAAFDRGLIDDLRRGSRRRCRQHRVLTSVTRCDRN